MNSKVTTAQISSNDRLSFTLLGAISLHVLIILGVGFDYLASNVNASSTIEVILVNTKTEQSPEDPKVIANNNQTASGATDIDGRPRKLVSGSQVYPLDTRLVENHTPANEKQQNNSNPQLLHVEKSHAERKINATDAFSDDAPKETPKPEPQPDELTRLVSEFMSEEEDYAKRPKINHIDTLSAKTAVEAEYVKDWVEKVELVGNINYPTSAKQQGISGQLIMSVLINFDGQIVETDIRQSSGHSILDSTAKKVVELAQPYREFPPDMREEYDQLMITRTWLFKSNTLITQ
jgi:protein TonB